MSNSTVTLNVGGILYTTTKFTLQKYPDSMLGAMMSGNYPTAVDAQGHIFIDRDGTVFRHILNFLRTSALCIPTDFAEMDLLHAEADFYQVVPLVELLRYQREGPGRGTVHFLEVIEVRTGSAATMPTSNSRVKTVLAGRRDALLSLPPALIGADVAERLQSKAGTEHTQLELYGSCARLKVGEALQSRGWTLAACDLASSSGFDSKSLHNGLVIEHSYRDRWTLTLPPGESFPIHPDHLAPHIHVYTNGSDNDSDEL